MNYTLPERLFSNEEKIKLINDNYCDNCLLLRRSQYIEFPTGELDTSIWSRKDIFGLSLNIYLCEVENLDIELQIEDVRLVCYDERNQLFFSNSQCEGIDCSKIGVSKDNNIILKMLFGAINNLSGSYPFGQKGSKEYTEFQYKLKVSFKPLLFNPFHFEIEVLSSENKFEKPIERNKLKGYQKSLASDIRNKILLDKLISPVK